MCEIDFIPESYRIERAKRRYYRRQYFVIAGIIAVMIAWSFITGINVSRVRAQVQDSIEFAEMGSNISAEYSRMEKQYKELLEDKEKIERVSNKVVFSDVIAELSYLVNDSIVFKSLNINTQEYVGAKRGGVRALSKEKKDSKVYPPKQFRYKVKIGGLAKDSSNVAQMIKELEESPYFDHVVPGFSRNVKTESGLVSEFELSCYIANYDEYKEGHQEQ